MDDKFENFAELNNYAEIAPKLNYKKNIQNTNSNDEYPKYKERKRYNDNYNYNNNTINMIIILPNQLYHYL